MHNQTNRTPKQTHSTTSTTETKTKPHVESGSDSDDHPRPKPSKTPCPKPPRRQLATKARVSSTQDIGNTRIQSDTKKNVTANGDSDTEKDITTNDYSDPSVLFNPDYLVPNTTPNHEDHLDYVCFNRLHDYIQNDSLQKQVPVIAQNDEIGICYTFDFTKRDFSAKCHNRRFVELTVSIVLPRKSKILPDRINITGGHYKWVENTLVDNRHMLELKCRQIEDEKVTRFCYGIILPATTPLHYIKLWYVCVTKEGIDQENYCVQDPIEMDDAFETDLKKVDLSVIGCDKSRLVEHISLESDNSAREDEWTPSPLDEYISSESDRRDNEILEQSIESLDIPHKRPYSDENPKESKKPKY